MKVIIQPLTVVLDKNSKGQYFLYVSEYKIYADSVYGLNDITKMLYENNLFTFNKYGNYIGTDFKTGLAYTVDDGSQSIEWLIRLLKWIKTVKKAGISAQFNINKSMISCITTNETMNEISPKMKDILIDSYIQSIIDIASINKVQDVLVTKIKKIKNNLKLSTAFDKLYFI